MGWECREGAGSWGVLVEMSGLFWSTVCAVCRSGLEGQTASAEVLRMINFPGQNSPGFFSLCAQVKLQFLMHSGLRFGPSAQRGNLSWRLLKGKLLWIGISLCIKKCGVFCCILGSFSRMVCLCCCCVLCPFASVRGDIWVLSSSCQAPRKVWARLLSLPEQQYLISCGKLCPFSP